MNVASSALRLPVSLLVVGGGESMCDLRRRRSCETNDTVMLMDGTCAASSSSIIIIISLTTCLITQGKQTPSDVDSTCCTSYVALVEAYYIEYNVYCIFLCSAHVSNIATCEYL